MGTIYVVYHSDTGNTKKLAEAVVAGAAEVAGTTAKLVAASELDYDAAAGADGYAIGSPDYFSYVAGQIKTFFDKVLYDKRFHGKPYVGFGTHGGGGKVLECLDRLAKSVKLNQVAPGVMSKGAPDASGNEQARKLGKALAEAI